MQNKIGVILMTYGSATTPDHVREYMSNIYHGKADESVIKDFEERYRLVGHSPLIEITKKQAQFLEDALNTVRDVNILQDSANKISTGDKPNTHYIVRAGMLHSKPFIEEAIRDCKNAGAERYIGIILSPQFSFFIMDGYRATFARAAEAVGFSQNQFSIADPWPAEPHFIGLLAIHIKNSLKSIGKNIPIVFTTHSLPQRVTEKDLSYLDQLKMTTDAVLEKLRHENPAESEIRWYSAYQSAGHTPEEWLKPDLTDILAELKERGEREVLIVPIQFLADHLEILYDLDIAARKQCEEFGLVYHRIELPNTNELFIKSLAAVTAAAIAKSEAT